MAFIEAHGLVKTYTPKGAPVVRALDGLDLEVPQGTVTALLGPNGAGKTTTVKVLTTLIKPDSGSAVINGVDVLDDPQSIRRMIGASGQYAAVDENLTGFENLMMVGKLYHLGSKVARQRASELIELFDLVESQNRPVKGYSGGMRRRIDLAGALVIKPPCSFSMSPRRASTRAAASACGTSSRRSSLTAPPCCSRRSTSKRPTASPTPSRSSTTARSSLAEPPTSSRPRSAASVSL
jgi:ABC-2 type transport system ATP-binding protein